MKSNNAKNKKNDENIQKQIIKIKQDKKYKKVYYDSGDDAIGNITGEQPWWNIFNLSTIKFGCCAGSR